jgi:hypothetical protein
LAVVLSSEMPKILVIETLDVKAPTAKMTYFPQTCIATIIALKAAYCTFTFHTTLQRLIVRELVITLYKN